MIAKLCTRFLSMYTMQLSVLNSNMSATEYLKILHNQIDIKHTLKATTIHFDSRQNLQTTIDRTPSLLYFRCKKWRELWWAQELGFSLVLPDVEDNSCGETADYVLMNQ